MGNSPVAAALAYLEHLGGDDGDHVLNYYDDGHLHLRTMTTFPRPFNSSPKTMTSTTRTVAAYPRVTMWALHYLHHSLVHHHGLHHHGHAHRRRHFS